jgi:hypothetical protein
MADGQLAAVPAQQDEAKAGRRMQYFNDSRKQTSHFFEISV